MIISKTKKVFLLILLFSVSTALSVVNLIVGKTKGSQAQAQCWTPPVETIGGADTTESSVGASGDCDCGATGGDCGDCY